jgi:hypothetical protein
VNNKLERKLTDAAVASFGTMSRHVSAGVEGKCEIPESAVLAVQLSAMSYF